MWRSGDRSPLILNLDTRRRLVVSFTLRSLYPQWKESGRPQVLRDPGYLLNRGTRGPQVRFGSYGEKKIL